MAGYDHQSSSKPLKRNIKKGSGDSDLLARKEAGYSKRVMASLLNVNPEALKAYE